MIHTTKMSSKSLASVHRTAYPSFSYLFSLSLPSIRASRMRLFTGEALERASVAAVGVKDRLQRTTPPTNDTSATRGTTLNSGSNVYTFVGNSKIVQHFGTGRAAKSARSVLLLYVLFLYAKPPTQRRSTFLFTRKLRNNFF
jgi:hypothetical protein